MGKNNFNKAYLYIISIFAIGLAISNIISFFGGVGFALVGSLVLGVLALTNILADNKKRFVDILVLLAIELLFMFILFFAYDFMITYNGSKFPFVMRNICATYSLICIAYIVFRFIYETKGWKFTCVEFVLGNYKRKPRAPHARKVRKSKAEVKKNKELENGTFEPKPSSVGINTQTKDIEEVSIIEDDEDTTVEAEDDESFGSVEDENKEDIIRF